MSHAGATLVLPEYPWGLGPSEDSDDWRGQRAVFSWSCELGEADFSLSPLGVFLVPPGPFILKVPAILWACVLRCSVMPDSL